VNNLFEQRSPRAKLSSSAPMFSPSQAARRVPNTLLKVGEIGKLRLLANSLDAALFSMSYHDIYCTPQGRERPTGDAGQMVGALYSAKAGRCRRSAG